MDNSHIPEHDNIPEEIKQQIDRVCLDFRNDWQAGKAPQIEDFVSRVPASGQQAVMFRLLTHEIELCFADGKASSRSEYLSRFQDDQWIVEAVFEKAAELSFQNCSLTDTVSHGPEHGPAQVDTDTHSPLALKGSCISDSESNSVQKQVGRFTIQKRLGQGGFGEVFLAYDPVLDRNVAIKIPLAERFSSAEELESFTAEAKTAARLKHANIVTMYDVVRCDQGLFIVQEFVDGQDLRQFMLAQNMPLPVEMSVSLILAIADAMAFAHESGFVHRDLKPENILLDHRQRPLVADFGLAVHENHQRRKRGEVSGSPLYMSPEQVRGETHRLDGRSDLWSIGVIFYELLTGRQPFRGENRNQVFDEILFREPIPIRQRRPDVSSELDRICQKCLTKRIVDRYSSAHDLIDDLQAWLRQESTEDSKPPNTFTKSETERIPFNLQQCLSSSPKVVPKGIRSYENEDSDFFLDLLPGPRDRDGIPACVRFWKTRIEEFSPARTFSVGLMYGPSGCGKSSLVKAGLLPLLPANIIPVYVDASADDTEQRIEHSLQRLFPTSPSGNCLLEMLAAIREDRCLPAGHKVLLVLDQFEQWLHKNSRTDNSRLVSALRQCDGSRIQAVLLTRDDFWLSISRFFVALEVRLAEGENSALVDLFDLPHARRVLIQIGQAFGRLPLDEEAFTAEQRSFLDTSLDGLAIEGRIVPMRLAILSDIFKNRPWTMDSLRQMGGTGGVGSAFLVENFESPLAPPEIRTHSDAIPKLFRNLLPESHIEIRGPKRSYDELRIAAEYSEKPREFQELIDLLDRRLHLIAPVDSMLSEELRRPGDCIESSSQRLMTTEYDISQQPKKSFEYYQLTHDYWVPSLREWLNRKQRSTRKGQAELKLAERAANWTIKSERKQLPTLREWLSICWRTRTRDWKKTEAWMMKQATRHHFTRLAIGLTLSVAALSSTLLYWGYISGRELETRVAGLVASLFSAEPSQLPLVITKLDEHCDWALQELQLVLNTPASTPDQKRALLHSRIFAVGFEPLLVEPLVDEMLTNKISYLPIIRDRLGVQATPLLAKFRQLLSDSTADSEQRLRAAMVLLKHVPPDDASFWTDADWRFISQQLVSANPELHPFIRQQIRLAKNKLLSSLEELAVEPNAAELELLGAANALIDFAEDDPKRLAGILADSNPSQFAVLFPTLAAAYNQESHEHLQNLAKELPADDLGSVARINFGKRRAGAAIGLLKLGKLAESLSALECTDDPEAMTQFIFGSRARGVRVEEILKSFDLASEATRRESADKTKYALLLALGEFDWEAIPLARRGALLNQLSDLYASDPSSAVHGATGWLLRHWGHHEIAHKVDQTPVAYSPQREWFTLAITVVPRAPVQPGSPKEESEKTDTAAPEDTAILEADAQATVPTKTFYFTFVVLPRGDYWIGSVEDEPSRSSQLGRELRHQVTIDQPFAILDREITFEELIAFWPGFAPLMRQYQQEPPCAGFGTSWYECVSFCRWLSEQQGLSEGEQVYSDPASLDPERYPKEPHVQASWAPRNWPLDLSKPGFRLPTEAEWESAARSGNRTAFGFGSDTTFLNRFGWFVENSQRKAHLTKKLRPNWRGLFDLHGNLHEWNQDWYADFDQPRNDNQDASTATENSELPDRALRSVRGGSWSYPATACRCTSRGGFNPADRDDFLGFRIVFTLPEKR